MIIPLAGAEAPSSAQELQSRIERAGTAQGLKSRAAVTATSWPQIDTLDVDVSGSSMADASSFSRGLPDGESSLSVQRFSLIGRPITFQQLPVFLESRGTSTLWKVAKMADGSGALILDQAGDGTLSVEVARTNLEAFAHAFLAGQAGKHGVNITETRISFASRGPRSLSLQADVSAKMMLVKATLTVTGDLDLDEALQLRFSNLKLTGGGMAAGLARGFLQPHFDRLQARPISLSALTFGGIRLRDAGLTVDGENLRLDAKFGS